MLKNLDKIKIKEINEPFFIFKPETLTKDVKYFLNIIKICSQTYTGLIVIN